MKTLNKHTITIYPLNESTYCSRAVNIALSEEFFNDKEIAKISSICFLAATRTNAGISVSASEVEVPEDVEEGWKVKYEASEKAKSEAESRATQLKREKLALEIKIAANALYEDNPDNLTLFCCIEQKLSELVTNSWERDGVKKVLVETGVLPNE